ncbi:MAG: CRISPR-associated endonuclease Cas3'' [bacterium]|nr:CRISPR-associated endonuclease Cas3'' [bacterium]
MLDPLYAHSREGHPKEAWHSLEDHLKATAALAARFANPLGFEDWAALAGVLHDLGKSSQAFQGYLSIVTEKVCIGPSYYAKSTAANIARCLFADGAKSSMGPYGFWQSLQNHTF